MYNNKEEKTEQKQFDREVSIYIFDDHKIADDRQSA